MLSYREYFEAEMRSLQDLAQEFAEAYPEQAALLNLNAIKDRDPYVERLLEGMAFLTSQIRHRLDDSIPEISQSLLEQIIPTMIRPYPAHSIVQLTPNIQNKEAISLDAGTSVKALNAGPLNANCEFSLTHDINVLPIALVHVLSEEKAGGGHQIRLTFKRGRQVNWQALDLSSFKMYLSADWPLAYALFHLFTDTQTQISLSSESRSVIPGGERLVCRPAHQSPKDSLLPSHGRSKNAFSLMHDYFCAREKYLFVDLQGLGAIEIPDSAEQFTVTFDAKVNLPVDTKLSPDHIRLFCSPAINLFNDDAEPIAIDHTKSELRVNPDRQAAEYTSIYSVDSVSGRDQSTGETYTYSPLHAMRHRKRDDRVFHTKNRTAGVDKRLTYLSVNVPPPFNKEVISIEATLTNDQYPRRYIDLNQVKKLPEQYSKLIEAANVTRPSKMLQAPDFQDYQWQLVSLLSIKLSSLESVDTIKHLLSLFDWTEQLENQRRIESIAGVRTKTTHRLRRGVLFQGLEITVELNETGFSSLSDMYLFGAVLHNFFSAFANMTEFVQTKVVQLPSYKEWTWSPVFGNKALF
jgi:type VI secretion system protein ImpG